MLRGVLWQSHDGEGQELEEGCKTGSQFPCRCWQGVGGRWGDEGAKWVNSPKGKWNDCGNKSFPYPARTNCLSGLTEPTGTQDSSGRDHASACMAVPSAVPCPAQRPWPLPTASLLLSPISGLSLSPVSLFSSSYFCVKSLD